MNLSEDRVIKFIDACFDAGIKRPDLFILSKMPQVYNWLKGSFPRGILPTDIDGEVEINGRFLRFEFKHEKALRNGAIPRGQYRAMRSLVETKYFTILLIGVNDMGDPTCCELWLANGKVEKLKDCYKLHIYKLCSQWSRYAETSKKRGMYK
jgi:hypothetical protein